jgi:nucleotide-binding universal stress UspA family protein
MLRTLLVPLDGSELAERALPYAVRFALANGGRVVLVRAALGPPPSGLDWERQQAAVVKEAETYLAQVARMIATRVPVATWVPYGHAAQEILKSVKQFDADGIVMATHGRTGPSHLVYGSVADAVLAGGSVPVILVHARPGEAVATPFDPPSARILVPLDGSSFAAAALPIAVEMLGIAGELVLVTVVFPPDHVERDEFGRVRAYLDQQEDAAKREAQNYLHTLIRPLKMLNPDLHVTCDIRIGDPAEGIVIAEVDRGVDLVVMATHARTGLPRAFLGSVAGAVLRTGHVPVLLVPPAAQAATASREYANAVSAQALK